VIRNLTLERRLGVRPDRVATCKTWTWWPYQSNRRKPPWNFICSSIEG